MKLSELLKFLRNLNDADVAGGPTVDRVILGPEEREVNRVAVTMFATAEVIRAAAAFGAQLLITHEPTFYVNSDNIDESDPWIAAKKKLIDASGMTVFRYHDHPHSMPLDLIDEGAIRYSGLSGRITGKPFWAVTSFMLDAPMTARRIAVTLQNNLAIKHIRIAGAMDSPGRGIAFACGTPGHIREAFNRPDVDFVVTGELCEWSEAEYFRSQAQLGGGKAVLVLGHCMSEYAGMRLLTDILRREYEGRIVDGSTGAFFV